MWVINLPLKVLVTKKKYFLLNLNAYRNAHHFTLNKAKVVFEEMVSPLIRHLPKMGSVEISYVLFKGSEVMLDTANVCSIVDKFFCDTLTGNGIIKDDTHDLVVKVSFSYGGIDRGNPRVEATIIPIGELPPEEKENTMKVILTQEDIETAIDQHIRDVVDVADDQRIDIEISATRKGAGFTAEVNIVDASAPVAEKPVKATKAPKVSGTTATPAANADGTPKRRPGRPRKNPAPEVVAQEDAQADAPVDATEQAPEAEQAEEVVTNDLPVEETPEETADLPTEPEAADEAEVVEAQIEVAPENEAEAAPQRTSLFSGLKKPTNASE